MNGISDSQKIVQMYAGSIAYGTNIETSDVDFRGIFCASPIQIRTPFFPVRECVDDTSEDSKLFELTHFMNLAIDCNPNIVELLWTDESDITYTTPAYELLRSHRSELLSKKIAFTTSGYALSQLKRIKGHNKWLNNPQSEAPPRQEDYVSLVYNLTSAKILPNTFDFKRYKQGYQLVHYGNNIYGLYESSKHTTVTDKGELISTDKIDKISDIEMDINDISKVPLLIVKYNNEEYKAKKETHKNYWTWKRNRNHARSELEEKFGYDSKHAMHLVRLLRMGREALTTGELIIKRPDAQELLNIRNGEWSYEELVEYAEEMDNEIRNVLYKSSELRKKPNIKIAGEVLMEVQNIMWTDAN